MYLAAFGMALAHSMACTAMPFLLKYLNATDEQIGIAFAAFSLLYVFACIAGGPVVDRFNSKLLVIISSVLIFVCTLGIYIFTATELKDNLPINPVLVVTVLFASWGVLLVLFWPPLMGWFSTGYEGPRLSRKLALYNVAWSSGTVAGPYIAGLIAEQSVTVPILVAAIAAILCAFAAAIVRKHAKTSATEAPLTDTISEKNLKLLPAFRQMSRLAMICSYVALGAIRAQMPILFKFELGHSESGFGMAITILALANMLGFLMLGKTEKWHYSIPAFFAVQFITILGLLIIMFTPNLYLMFIATALIGGTLSFTYICHHYYGVTGTKKRSGFMALHELLLSVGQAGGAFAAGYLAQHIGRRYSPYLFCVIFILTAIAAQFIIYKKNTRKN